MGSKSSGSSSRPVTAEELALWEAQKKSLQLADKVAAEQWGLSKTDREYFGEIYRGEADPNDPSVRAKIEKAVRNTLKVNPSMSKEAFIEQQKEAGVLIERDGKLYNPDGGQYDDAKGYQAYMDTYNSALDDTRSAVLAGLQDKSKSVDTILFDAVKSSKDDLAVALTAYADNTAAMNAKFGAERTGISSKFTAQMESLAGDYNNKMQYATKDFIDKSEGALGKFDANANKYQSAYEQIATSVSSRMGQADTDILAQQRGQQLAGISQSYKQAQDELLSTLSRRGMAGSGVEAGALTQLAQGQAQTMSGALSGSYNQAIALSDQRRLQQYGIAGEVAQSGIGLQGQQLQGALGVSQGIYGARGSEAQSSYNVGVTGAQTGYNTSLANITAAEQKAAALEAMRYQGATGNVQQNLANLQMASGVSQGVYGGASNMLSGAGSTANQSASIAGQSASSIGQLNNSYAQTQAENSGGAMGIVTGLVGKAGAAYLGSAAGSAQVAGLFASSDRRLKTNIVKVGESNGYNIYTWDWIEGHDYGYNTGVIAQEVMEINPEAVTMMDNGYYAVNYKALGV